MLDTEKKKKGVSDVVQHVSFIIYITGKSGRNLLDKCVGLAYHPVSLYTKGSFPHFFSVSI